MNPRPVDDCAGCASCGLFAALGPAERIRLEQFHLVRECRRGQVLFYQGEELPHLIGIQQGFVKLLKTDSLGREIVIRFLGPGDVAGFRPLLAGEPSAAAAECVTPARLCLVPRALFLEFATDCRPFARLLLGKLARELRESEERWLSQTRESAEQRVIRFLAQLAHRHVEAGGVRVEIPKLEIARAADVTPSTLSRILGRLSRRGLLTVESRALTLLPALSRPSLP
ncbi:MAG: Crp/Fnr family transcriptional regulator [Candidatus Delongbacteria bacterium]